MTPPAGDGGMSGEGGVSGGGPASPILANVYQLVSDSSDGMKPAAGSTITLNFLPNGKALFFAISSTETLSYHGTYTYGGGEVDLSFTATDFARSGKFALSLTAAQITIPFQVFSTKPGSSTWTTSSLDAPQGAYYAAFGLGSDPDVSCLTTAQINYEAAEYVSAWTGLSIGYDTGLSAPPPISYTSGCAGSGGDAGADAGGMSKGRRRPYVERFGDAQPVTTPALEPANVSPPGLHILSGGPAQSLTPTDLLLTYDGLFLTYPGGLKLFMDITGNVQPKPGAPLAAGQFASDPRTNLVPDSPHDPASDPKNKSALLISPFADASMGTGLPWEWAQEADSLVPTLTPVALLDTLAAEDGIQSSLGGYGYTIKRLDGANATAGAITAALQKTPGVVEFFTHGNPHGGLGTADFLGTSQAHAWANLATLSAQLESHFKGISSHLEIEIHALGGHDLGGIVASYGLGLNASYWEWMRDTYGADLGSSLVYIGACHTDEHGDLREAILAKSYFAFNDSLETVEAGAIGQYLVTIMTRPTTSAEEAFYNAIRVSHSRLMQFDADAVLNIKVGLDDFSAIFNGYGFEGGGLYPYRGFGWLTTKIKNWDQGQVWYLLWAARSGQNTMQGATNLETCWKSWWQKGMLGGISSPYCQNANDGNVPTADEVAYTIYLLSGSFAGSPGYTGMPVPRMTLNDGK